MAKGILEFSLPEEDVEFKTAQNGAAYKVALTDFDNALRSKMKHTNEKPESYEQVREMFHEVLKDVGVDIYE